MSDMVLGYITGFIKKKKFTILNECAICKYEFKSPVQSNKLITARLYTKKIRSTNHLHFCV